MTTPTKFQTLCVEAEMLRQAKVAARQKRDACLCPDERFAYDGEPLTGSDPCWKRYEIVSSGGPVPEPVRKDLPRGEWCDDCRERQRHHDEYMALTRKLGAVRATLTRMGR